jgi:ubiquinone/menaquinone biosynthesis C-methylase UbiE
MENATWNRVASVKFWDNYAKWYKLWIEHTYYQERIIRMLLSMTEPGWKVLNIGAGNGILSIPLYVRGCEVTAFEPSVGMRNLLYQEALKSRMDGFNVDERIWEEVPCYEYLDYDLILACNTLHLTQIGFEEALRKVFRTRAKNIFLVFELNPPYIGLNGSYEGYRMLFKKFYEIENSFAYHHLDEMIEHWTLMKGKPPQSDEVIDLKKRIIFQEGHLWIKNTSQIMMCWWKRNGRGKNASQHRDGEGVISEKVEECAVIFQDRA